ncbi:unnamed protein product [Rotaria sp. Silwood2]|nr:unnamed protein product [Rotaria sp. Silwood2]
MFVFYLSIVHLTLSQDFIAPLIFSDCTHLILPSLCQCYHSGEQSQLHCHNIQLNFIPKLPNNMHWYALDFSLNNIKSVDSYVFSDIYVEKLNLKSNYLQTIDITAFDQIKNLKQLFLDHNQLKKIDPKALISPGVSLEIFDLSYNPLEYLDLGQIFIHLSLLREFYAVSCQLTNSSLFTLLKLTEYHHHIKIIDLKNNNNQSILDLNHNPNLKCNCTLIQFEKYLINYLDLTCTHHGQDRYFISKVTNLFSNCTRDFCIKQKKEHLCEWTNAEKLILEGTCQVQLIKKENSTKNESELIITIMNSNLSEIIVDNATKFYNNTQKSFALSIKRVDYIWFFIVLFLLYI